MVAIRFRLTPIAELARLKRFVIAHMVRLCCTETGIGYEIQNDTGALISKKKLGYEICWYFTESWEQFRISGRIDVVDSSTKDLAKQQQREKCWFASSLRSRLLYLGPSPRLPALHEEPSTNQELDLLKGPVDTFGILVFDPEQVDYLNLKRNERLLFKSSHSSSKESVVWQLERVNP